jgi:hypothetical protein
MIDAHLVDEESTKKKWPAASRGSTMRIEEIVPSLGRNCQPPQPTIPTTTAVLIGTAQGSESMESDALQDRLHAGKTEAIALLYVLLFEDHYHRAV